MGITSDVGGNIQVCREALESKYINDSFFPHPIPSFAMEYLANILARACKVGVHLIKSYDGDVDTELTRYNMQKCMTWKNKSQKGAQALRDAHIHCKIKDKRLLTPVLTHFAYLIHSFRSLLYNKPSIVYLYGIIP